MIGKHWSEKRAPNTIDQIWLAIVSSSRLLDDQVLAKCINSVHCFDCCQFWLPKRDSLVNRLRRSRHNIIGLSLSEPISYVNNTRPDRSQSKRLDLKRTNSTDSHGEIKMKLKMLIICHPRPYANIKITYSNHGLYYDYCVTHRQHN